MSISNVIKFNETGIPPWTVDDEGKVLSIKENKLAWVEMNGTPVEPEVEEYKWVVTPNKYTIYNEEGTTLKTEDRTLTEWECPKSGNYVVQLHAQGGTGGNWMGQQVSQGSYPLVTYSTKQFTGGGGGGSGAKITLNINKGQKYSLSVNNNKSTFGDYYVDRGENGSNADFNSSTPGTGGEVGSYHSSLTLMAEKGEDGTKKVETSATSGFGYKKASGGSGYAIKDANDTVGYGSGGRSGTGQYVFVADDRIYTEEGEEGQGPAIIIRRKLE